MLAYKNRFHGHNSLRFVLKNGTASRTRTLTVKTNQNPRRRSPRISVVVSKKISKKAVQRNRIRRKVYEIFRDKLPYMVPNIDIVCIITSPELLIQSHDDIEVVIDRSLLEQGVYAKAPESAIIRS